MSCSFSVSLRNQRGTLAAAGTLVLSSFCSLSHRRGLAPTADQSQFTSTVTVDTRGVPQQKAHPKSLQILLMQSKQDSQQCELPQEADIGQPLRSGLEGSFKTRSLIVSARVMSARSAANSFMPLSPNSSFHSVYQCCQRINPWLSTAHSSLSQLHVRTQAAKTKNIAY